MTKLTKIVLKTLLTVAVLTLLTGCSDDKSGSAQKAQTNATATTSLEQKIAVGLVDTDRVFTSSEAGKAAVKHLETIADKLQKEFIKLQEEVKGKEKDPATVEKFQTAAAKLEEKFKAEEEQVMASIEKTYQATLDSVRKSENLQIVIAKAQALSFEAERDITDKVIAEMNKHNLTFTELKSEKEAEKDQDAQSTNSTKKETNSTK
ncbi:OmpH family outer membrane protein [Desulfovibrio litoralis]|uniref:Periplasmic chaperone for outer membrane proteins Skp n=1 Tax=Desulfovibrio litoralis DSM 11393 TaxID=1121455 RepID=A0A1M7T691_9BACT|nr:OmpH family outer membrane protein [Desulfovibrio litoralis]SHN66142.1 periplasmic chaperone for outer membrane proteins Skp [Desulfovibrio litoralis DSM 11393]